MSKELIEQARAWQTPSAPIIKALADRIEELEREIERKMSAAAFVLKERDALLADNARLRDALGDTLYFLERHSNRWDGINGKHPNEVACAARSSLSSTHEQSLAEYRNKVIEQMIACYSPDDSAHDYFDKLNALKGQS